MRILHIGKYYPPYAGGMEIFLRDLLKAQRKRSLEVAALVHHHKHSRKSSKENIEGIPIVRTASLGQILYAPVSPTFPLVLKKIIRSFRPHLLHFHFPNPSAFWSLALSEARLIPWMIQWQSDVVPSSIDRRLEKAYRCYRPLEQGMLKRAQKILVASKPYLQNSVPLKPWISKCTVIPLGVDPERLPWPEPLEIERAEKSWPSGCLRVLSVGRLTYYKGFDVLIRAVGRTRNTAVQIVGEGNLKAELEAEVRRQGVQRQVRLRGGLSNKMLQALFATCDLFCLPSLERTEAFGVVLLEAMRYGKPIVASDIPGSGPGWVVKEGDCGWLVPPGNADALAKKVAYLAAKPSLRREAGQKGQQNFNRKFHIQSVAQGIGDIYGDMVFKSGLAGS
jgi:rhamnosyl/mannosyltransferase